MTVTKLQETKLEQRISGLEAEIALQQKDVQNLTEALASFKGDKPRPANPSADDAFSLIRELVGSAPQRLEERQIYDEKLKEAQRALELAVAAVEQKQSELKTLQQERRSQQQTEAFEQLKSKASRFNSLIDEAMAELEQMREFAKVVGSGKFEVVSDIREMPYCSITSSIVRIRRRFDVRQG